MMEANRKNWRIADLHSLGMYQNDGSITILGGEGDDAFPVASVHAVASFRRGEGHKHTGDAERDLHARMIAAAPDLLDFAEALDASWTEAFQDGPDGEYGSILMGDEHRALWRQCRAAIAKAQGAA